MVDRWLSEAPLWGYYGGVYLIIQLACPSNYWRVDIWKKWYYIDPFTLHMQNLVEIR